MARAIALCVTAGVLAALLVVPEGATAGPGPRSRLTPPTIDQEIGEQGTNGFYVTVKVHDRHLLELSATKFARNGAIEGASYKMPYHARPGSDEIKGRFGKLGRVNMRFMPEEVKQVKPLGSNCKGGDITEERGFWAGLLAFHGEDGFTRIRVHGALGTVVKAPSLRCRPERPLNLKKLKRELEALEKELAEAREEDEGKEETEVAPPPFTLVASARHDRISLVASRASFREGKKTSSGSTVVVVGSRRRGRIEETATVLDAFAPGSYVRPLDSREPAVETVVKPPEPFSGAAAYRDPPHRPRTWTGDLKVELPGFGAVRLTGGGTHAVACETLFEPRCRRGLKTKPGRSMFSTTERTFSGMPLGWGSAVIRPVRRVATLLLRPSPILGRVRPRRRATR